MGIFRAHLAAIGCKGLNKFLATTLVWNTKDFTDSIC